jgi:FMN phosphatase YigB (HAD superfamily)
MKVATVGAARRAKVVSACSFDVFDTFIVRACTTPDGVFEKAYEISGLKDTHPNASENFVQHRILAEARARKEAEEKRGTVEVRITDIYSFFPFKLFGLDREALNDLAVAEFRAELDLCRANPEMLQQYLEMKRGGFHVGFISDTYWSTKQLSHLLRNCSPDLTWDFLYASCDHGHGKSGKLFAKYLSEQKVDPATSFHIGDNERADVKGARRHGLRSRYYPQASAKLTSTLQRETSLFELLAPGQPSRLDLGARTLRRMVTARNPEKSAAFHLGMTVLGPVMTAFDAFIEARCSELTKVGGKVAIGFLGRDGFLSHRIWQSSHDNAASYIEVNRRVSMIAAADTLVPLRELIGKIPRLDAGAFTGIVKVLPPKVAAYFQKQPQGIAIGKDLAESLPDLMSPRESAALAGGMRERLLTYLRTAIPDFDSCTDLVLIDLGYSGSVQKALRRLFDREHIRIRLHGTYLLTLDDAFHDLARGDTVQGMISDLVVTPHLKRTLLRNIALLELLCSSPEGSVRDYRDGEVQREANPIPAEQIAFSAEVQAGAIAFAASAREIGASYGLQPFAPSAVGARWTAATLGRLLLLPDDDELALLSTFQHDVNLGTATLQPMIDSSFTNNAVIARGLTEAYAGSEPPMWLAGSFASLSPLQSYLYTLFGANRLSADVFGDAPCGTIEVGLFKADGAASMEAISLYRSGLGDLRIHVPIARKMNIAMIALPLAKFARAGILHGVVVRAGTNIDKASKSPDVKAIAFDTLVFGGMERNGRHYHASNDDGCLIIPVGPCENEVSVYTIAFTSLSHDRILSTTDAGSEDAAIESAEPKHEAPLQPMIA